MFDRKISADIDAFVIFWTVQHPDVGYMCELAYQDFGWLGGVTGGILFFQSLTCKTRASAPGLVLRLRVVVFGICLWRLTTHSSSPRTCTGKRVSGPGYRAILYGWLTRGLDVN